MSGLSIKRLDKNLSFLINSERFVKESFQIGLGLNLRTFKTSHKSQNQSINQSFNVSNSRYKPELQERSETANISSIGI